MKHLSLAVAAATALGLSVPSLAASPNEIAALRQALQQLRSDYEQRIRALEARLAQAEQEAHAAAQASLAPPASAGGASDSANRFNPSIGLVLNGRAATFSRPEREDGIAGFATGDEGSKGQEGLTLDESELNLRADIDDRFYGELTASYVSDAGEDGIEIEEAFVQTTALGHGLTLRGGRFLSAIGYLNDHHTHTDDFADRPLPYLAMLNNAYKDDGVQLRWVAPTDRYLELGGEYLRGARFPAGDSANQGMGAYSLFARTGGDIGSSASWRAGLSLLHAKSDARSTGNGDLFDGTSRLWIADGIYKWAPNGNPYEHSLTLQGELLFRSERGLFTADGGSAARYDAHQLGWYGQAVYQLTHGWRLGGRIAGLHAQDPGAAFDGTVLDTQGQEPREYSLMLDWSNSEFSRLRLQYNRDESRPRSDNQFLLQYIMALGAHGAHAY